MFLFPAGCILAELHTGFPLFPGENEVEQLACIMEIIGLPPYEMLMRATRRKYFFGEEIELLKYLSMPGMETDLYFISTSFSQTQKDRRDVWSTAGSGEENRAQET